MGSLDACPHVNGPMIAAGFLRCAVCEKNPAAMKEDTSVQEARVVAAYAALDTALVTLASEAVRQAKACTRKRPNPDLDQVRAAIRGLDKAEQDVDTAVYDLQTARGADG